MNLCGLSVTVFQRSRYPARYCFQPKATPSSSTFASCPPEAESPEPAHQTVACNTQPV